jgi:hypothetical protein
MSGRTGERLPNRRRFLQLGATTAAALGLAATPTGQAILGDSLERILPFTRPIFEGTPLEIITPENNFRSCKAYQNKFTYTAESFSSRLVVGFGDSNMYGDHVWPPPNSREKPTSVLTHLKDLVQLGYGAQWEPLNLAIPGYTTAQVKDIILEPQNIKQVRSSKRPWDILVNAGGNNFRTIMDNPARAALMQELSRQPLNPEALVNAPMLKEIALDLHWAIQQFGAEFYELLITVADHYVAKPAKDKSPNEHPHIGVITASDFSKAPQVHSSLIEEQVYHYNMQHRLVRALTRDLSTHLNDKMTWAMDQFSQKRPDVRLVAIDTWDLEQEHFGKDQHWNDPGKLAIAEKILRQAEIRKVA